MAVLALLLTAASCPPHPPTPTPTPTPTPEPGIKYADMILRKCGTGQFCQNGAPIPFRGMAQCCLAWDGGRDGWPMVSVELVDWAAQTHGVNFFHIRPGPFNVADEPEWIGIGGAYVEVNGKADLTQFNPGFWAEFERIVDRAGSVGAWVEVDLIDSWRLKGDCGPSPWNPGRNLQGQNHCITSHRGPGDAVHDAFLRQIVATIGRYANVIFQVGNESANVAGKNDGLAQWEKWVRDRIRVYEQEVGLGVVHMIGTNSGFDQIESAWPDYINTHSETPLGPKYGKPYANNELNPQGPPAEVLWQYCRALKGGAYFWDWRAAQPTADWNASLAAINVASRNACKDVDTSDCPFDVKPTTALRCKEFGVHGTCEGTPCKLYDCTPINSGQPVWPEGNPELRSACEQLSMGGLPTFSLSAPLRVDHYAHGGLAFAVGGHGASPAECHIPKEPAAYRGCIDTNGSPLTVTR